MVRLGMDRDRNWNQAKNLQKSGKFVKFVKFAIFWETQKYNFCELFA
jgi:hypothetical protein